MTMIQIGFIMSKRNNNEKKKPFEEQRAKKRKHMYHEAGSRAKTMNRLICSIVVALLLFGSIAVANFVCFFFFIYIF